jgi:hypothetical protein
VLLAGLAYPSWRSSVTLRMWKDGLGDEKSLSSKSATFSMALSISQLI